MSVKLFACGDIVHSGAATGAFVSPELQKTIQQSDIAIANFEAPVISEGRAISKVGPHISQPSSVLTQLKSIGFDLVSLANNHIYDYGQTGLEKTLKTVKGVGLGFVGAGATFDQAYTPLIWESADCKIGFLAFCEAEFGCLCNNEERGGYAYILHPSVPETIRRVRDNVDALVIIAHAGVEETDIPLPEWRACYRRFCDMGADAVIAHHPHVPQGWERYKDKLIFYSLGNFYFDQQNFGDEEKWGYSVLLTLGSSGFEDYQILTHHIKDGLTTFVKDEQSCKKLEYLCHLLKDGYEKRADSLAVELYRTRYARYYKIAAGVVHEKMSIKDKVCAITKQLFSKNNNDRNKKLLLLHNIRIDSHRFVTQRALSLLYE